MKVKIIAGTYGWRSGDGSVEPVSKGGICDVPDTEAMRLLGLGIATYVDKERPQEAVVTTPPGDGGNNPGSTIHEGGGGTQGQETGGRNEPVLDFVGGPYTGESLLQLPRKTLDEMADALGVDAAAIKKCNNKGDFAALIAAVEVAEEDEEEDEEPPHPTIAVPGT